VIVGAIISVALRVLIPVLIIAGLCVFSYREGVSRESDRRDAQAFREKEQADKDYEAAAQAATTHAVAAIDWKRKAENYYRKWREEFDDVNDGKLSECITIKEKEQPVAVAGCLLSDDWVRLYNASWFPDGAPDAPTGTDATAVGSGSATPREALANIQANAQSCAQDRKRQRELINLLQERESARAR
jgi:hypothetical protein